MTDFLNIESLLATAREFAEFLAAVEGDFRHRLWAEHPWLMAAALLPPAIWWMKSLFGSRGPRNTRRRKR